MSQLAKGLDDHPLTPVTWEELKHALIQDQDSMGYQELQNYMSTQPGASFPDLVLKIREAQLNLFLFPKVPDTDSSVGHPVSRVTCPEIKHGLAGSRFWNPDQTWEQNRLEAWKDFQEVQLVPGSQDFETCQKMLEVSGFEGPLPPSGLVHMLDNKSCTMVMNHLDLLKHVQQSLNYFYELSQKAQKNNCMFVYQAKGKIRAKLCYSDPDKTWNLENLE